MEQAIEETFELGYSSVGMFFTAAHQRIRYRSAPCVSKSFTSLLSSYLHGITDPRVYLILGPTATVSTPL